MYVFSYQTKLILSLPETSNMLFIVSEFWRYADIAFCKMPYAGKEFRLTVLKM